MLYLYGIIDRPKAQLALPRGLEGAAPDILPCTGLGAVAGSISDGAPEDGDDNLRRHLEVIKAVMAHHPIWPARFGSVFAEREELHDYISESREELLADIERVRGHSEICLRVADRQPLVLTQDFEEESDLSAAPEALSPGARLLAVRRAEAANRAVQKRAVDSLAASVMAPMALLATDSKWRQVPSCSGRPSIVTALLLRQELLFEFRLALAEFRRSHPWLEITCEGPLPPFSFVNGDRAVVTSRPVYVENEQRLAG
jgi:hypothetical protein